MKVKLSKQEYQLTQITQLLKICQIQRLSEKRALQFLETNGCKMSASSYYRYIKDYRDTIGDRFLDLMRVQWAEEHLLVLDVVKRLEEKYWELFAECDNPMDGKAILDSIRALQGEKLMIYNDVPFLTRMREIYEERIKALPEPKRVLKKIET